MDDALYLAVDLGAGSGRVFLAGIGTGEWRFEEVRRFQYPPTDRAGHLRWDFETIVSEVLTGLRAASWRAHVLGRPVASIGVDSWGVDYGLIDGSGELVEPPVCYRDHRTDGMMDAVFARVPRAEVVERTGIQCLPLNTLYQLYAHAREGIPQQASKLLLIPDLLHRVFTHHPVVEYTNASTTQLVNTRTGEWDLSLAQRLDLPMRLFPEIVPAGTDLGPLVPALARDLGLTTTQVVAPATHDTASAVVGTPLRSGWAYISSGTWSLVGVERDDVLVNADVVRHNFTNEGGAFDTVRFLKNVMGLWILESCRKEWRAAGLDLAYDALLAEVAALPESPGVIFPDDPRFFSPSSMLSAVEAQLRETGQSVPATPAGIARVVLDSLAWRYASVIAMIDAITHTRTAGVHIVGGGSLNAYLNQATANATGLPVLAGPVEATVIGNTIVQAIARGRFPSLEAARAHTAAHVPLREYAPVSGRSFDAIGRRYQDLAVRLGEP
jgi:rhamnulokinase